VECVLRASSFEGVGDRDSVRVVEDFGGHPGGEVGLVVQAAGEPGDQAARDVLADEDDASATLGGDVEAKVDLREVAEAGPGNTEHTGAEEIECDQTDVRAAFEELELSAGRAMREEELFGAGVSEQTDVMPISGEEAVGHVTKALGPTRAADHATGCVAVRCPGSGPHFMLCRRVIRPSSRLICCLALAVAPLAGCTSDGGAGGSAGGSADAGTGGAAGSSTTLCEPTTDRCRNVTGAPHEPCCEQEVPEQADACAGTESIESPTTCTATGDVITYRLATMELEGDCNVGYDLDQCEGQSCVPDGLTPDEGLSGVDNALAGFAVAAVGVGVDLHQGFNQQLSDALCGRTDFDDEVEGCETDIIPLDIRFAIDTNLDESCANVDVLAGGEEAGSAILNLSAPNGEESVCASGELGPMPLLAVDGQEGLLTRTVVRMTLSSAGFSKGLLGGVIDADTAVVLIGDLFPAGVTSTLFDIDASTPPTAEALTDCDALSATLRIGGIAE